MGGASTKPLSARSFEKLYSLQTAVRKLSVERNFALRLFAASRNAATAVTQKEFWLEFAWVDQEYRMAVHRLASFCAEHAGQGGRKDVHVEGHEAV